jgi:hypothetical protein
LLAAVLVVRLVVAALGHIYLLLAQLILVFHTQSQLALVALVRFPLVQRELTVQILIFLTLQLQLAEAEAVAMLNMELTAQEITEALAAELGGTIQIIILEVLVLLVKDTVVAVD